jgi:hypothetical protein
MASYLANLFSLLKSIVYGPHRLNIRRQTCFQKLALYSVQLRSQNPHFYFYLFLSETLPWLLCTTRGPVLYVHVCWPEVAVYWPRAAYITGRLSKRVGSFERCRGDSLMDVVGVRGRELMVVANRTVSFSDPVSREARESFANHDPSSAVRDFNRLRATSFHLFCVRPYMSQSIFVISLVCILGESVM